jgi:hypothetical protein
MQKPYRFTAVHNITKEYKEYNSEMLHPRDEWQPVDEKTRKLVNNWTVYIDTRYEAKLRLYNYLTYTKQGKEIPRYKPFQGTEIGKTIPILNF